MTVTVEEPAPDLVVLGPNVSDSSPETGGTFRLIVTVQNVGEMQAAATSMQYYRSTDATITTSDTAVGTEPVRALGVFQASAKTISLTAPSTAGRYYYGGCVDAVAGESDTTNNCSASVQVDVSEPPPPPPPPPTSPDLMVGSPTVSDSCPATGASFTLSATVTNAGDGASAATTMRYYRSSDATITTSDTQVATHAVGALAAGATSDESGGLTAPSTAGRYYYGGCVDAVAGESDTTNNCSASVQVDVSEPPPPPPPPPPPTSPDLVVDPPSVSDSGPAAGAAFTLSAEVRNGGDGDSAATTLRYYESADATITTSDTEVGTDAVGGLAASAASSQSVELTAPASAGTYYYGACVDAVADESDTANNCSTSVQVDVSEPPPPPTSPDLMVGSPSVSDSSPAAGAAFTLSAEVQNAGDGDSAATTLRYYESADATITTSDTEVGTDAVGGLAASAASSQSVELTAPASAGTYYYGACVDAVTGESDTTNNCSTSVRVTVPPEPVPAAAVQQAVDDVIAAATNGDGLRTGGASVTVPLDALFTFTSSAASAVTYAGATFSASSTAPGVVSVSITEDGPGVVLSPGADAGTAMVTVDARPEGQPDAPPLASVMFEVEVARAPSMGATLSGLVLSDGTGEVAFTPAFDPATQSYTASVANSVTSVTVTATVADDSATVTVNDVAVASGSPGDEIDLEWRLART